MHRSFRTAVPLAMGLVLLAAAAAPSAAAAGAGPVLLTEPEAGASAVVSAIEAAKTSIDVEMYVITDHSVEDALAAAARRGVKVRVILDRTPLGLGSDAILARQFLSAAGAAVRWAPSRFVFDHAKTMVVDHRLAFFGSANFTYDGLHKNREYDIETRDPAVVNAVAQVFQDDWKGLRAGAGPRRYLVLSPHSQSALLGLIASARHRLYLEEEETPEQAVADALMAAARRGVKVVLLEASTSSNRSGPGAYQLGLLARAGVKAAILPHPYLHAKLIIADSRVFVGSENVSNTSLEDNREVGIILNNPAFLPSVLKTFHEDQAASRPVSTNLPKPVPTTLLHIVGDPSRYMDKLVSVAGTINGQFGPTAFFTQQVNALAGGIELWLGDVTAPPLHLGDKVSVLGYVNTYNGQLEVEAVIPPTVTGRGNLPAPPLAFTGQLGRDSGLLVWIKGIVSRKGGQLFVNDGSGLAPIRSMSGTADLGGAYPGAHWTALAVVVNDNGTFGVAPVLSLSPEETVAVAPPAQGEGQQLGTVTLRSLASNLGKDMGATVTVKGATVDAVTGSNAFVIQNGAGMRLYPAPTNPVLVPGDVITFTGRVALYDGDSEIDVAGTPKVTGHVAAPAPVHIHTAQIDAANNYVYAQVTGKVTAVHGPVVDINDGSGTGELYFPSPAIRVPAEGSTFTAVGPVDGYKGTYQLEVVATAGSSAPASATSAPAPTATLSLATLAGSLAAHMGQSVSLKDLTVTAVLSSGSNLYVTQDGHWMRIYLKKGTRVQAAPGDVLDVTGTVATYQGTPEIDATSAPTVVRSGPAPSPQVITAASVNTAHLEDFVRMTGKVVSATSATFQLASGGNVTVYVPKGGPAMPKVGAHVTVVGIINLYKGHFQLEASSIH